MTHTSKLDKKIKEQNNIQPFYANKDRLGKTCKIILKAQRLMFQANGIGIKQKQVYTYLTKKTSSQKWSEETENLNPCQYVRMCASNYRPLKFLKH